MRVSRNPRGLHFHRFEPFAIEEALQFSSRRLALLGDKTHRRVRRSLRNRPIKVRRVLRFEPHSRGARARSLGQFDDRLLNRRRQVAITYCVLRDAAIHPVSADQRLGRERFFAVSLSIANRNFDPTVAGR